MATVTQPISGIQKQILECVVRRTTTEQRLVNRAQIVLAFGNGVPKKQIAREQGMNILTVRKWCSRWEEAMPDLLRIEEKIPLAEEPANARREYNRQVLGVLDDAYRCGAPPTFTAEEAVQIVALACEVLDESDEAQSHWTYQHIAQESVKRGIVNTISASTVGRFLKSGSY
jgi:putative transposase